MTLIPNPRKGDSRKGFPRRVGCDSPWQTRWGFVMGAAVGLRGDYAAGQLRGLAKRSVDAAQRRRLLALAAIYEGGSCTAAAKIGAVRLPPGRDWGLAFNADGPRGLIEAKAPGYT